MKVFLVSLALLILNISLLSFTSDMDRYVMMQGHLKALAEECAAGGALLTDGSEYSYGRLCINKTDALDYAAFLIGKAEKNMPPFAQGSIEASVMLFDDVTGYSGSEDYLVYRNKPALVVTLTYEGKDMFRLPFITVTHMERTATYQWEDGLTY